MIQYTILRVDNKITEDEGEVHAYSRVSSNKDTLRKYAKEIARSHRGSKVYLMEVNKAKAKEKEWQQWLKNTEQKKLDRLG